MKSAPNLLPKALGVLFNGLSLEEYEGLQPADFAAIKTIRGPLFDTTLSTAAEINELAGIVQHLGIKRTYDYLLNTVIPMLNELYESGQTPQYSIITFHSPLLESERQAENAMLVLNEDKGPLTDIVSCPKCGAPKVHRKMAQTRSADEGQTSIYTCPNCGAGWSEG